MNRWRKTGVVLALGSVLLAAGCGKTSKGMQPFDDADVQGHNENTAIIGNMPDGFNNFATKCDHGNRVYVIFHDSGDGAYGSIAVVPNDKSCADVQDKITK